MTRETLREPVEQFTIAVETGQDGDVLRLSWDTTSYVVPVSITNRE
jgi:hypothetical protein